MFRVEAIKLILSGIGGGSSASGSEELLVVKRVKKDSS